MNTNPKFSVVLKLSKRVPDFIRQARAVVAGLTGNRDLPTPNPPVATLQAQVDALDLAETASHGRTHGAAQARNAARDVVATSLMLERAYVQSVVNSNAERGDAIAGSAGMSVKAQGVRVRPHLAVRKGAVPGSVIVTAKSLRKQATYQWEYSSDQGHTWTDLPTTFVAKTSAAGLTILQTYSFRFRTYTKAGFSEWSDVVLFLVT